MRRRRILVISLAIALGAIAASAAYSYLSGVQDRAYHNAQLVDVYVATGSIPRGMSGSAALRAGLISQSQVPVKFRPIKAVTDTTTITTGVAQNDIPAQQVIVNGLFAVPGSTGGTAAQLIPKGDVAISISVDQVHGVAGLVEPGDNVDMLVQVSPGSGSANSREAYLYQDVPVLAVGSATTSPGAAPASGAAAQAQPSGIYTFAVPPPAAARIAMAQSGAGGVTGSIYLALVPPGNAANTQVPISSQNLLPSNPTPR